MKKYIILLLMLPLLAVQCRKDKNTDKTPDVHEVSCPAGDTACELAKLPPVTTTGANTFGCLLNGKAWVAINGYPGDKYLDADYYRNQFEFNGLRFDEDGNLLYTIRIGAYDYFFDSDSLVIGANATGRTTNYKDRCIWFPPAGSSFNEVFEGHIKILRLDTINRIVSATFEFTHMIDRYNASEEFCTRDTNIITNGRADILFKL